MAEQQAERDVDHQSLGELVGQLSEQSSRLVRDELALAKTELRASAKHAGVGAGLFGVAGLFGLLGAATLVASAVAGLSQVLDVWLAALIIAVVLLVIAGLAALAGRKQVSEAGPPEKAIANVKKDIAEVKERRSS